MEPMTVGSPASSPIYPGVAAGGVVNPGGVGAGQYLQSYPQQNMTPGGTAAILPSSQTNPSGFAPSAVSSPFQQQHQHQHPHSHLQQQGHHVSFSTPTGPNPATPNAPAAGAAAGGGFLPGYLMGDYSQQGSGRMLSPTKLSRSHSQRGHSTPQGGNHHLGVASAATPTSSKIGGFLTPTATASAAVRNTPSDKTGPPTTGLFSSRGGATGLTPKLSGTPGSSRLNSTPMPGTPHLSFGGTPNAGSVREEIFNASSVCQDVPNTWVTVFGFPPSASSYVLSQFSQYGTILQHHIPPNGNWMHLKYQTKMQAQKAVGKTGRVLGGSIMIGVSPCTDPNVTEENGAAADHSILGRSHILHNQSTAAADQSVTTLNSSLGGARLNSSIRPLTQAYKSAANDSQIAGSNSTPNRSSGLVGKAMEYIFGW